jgi:hypothetical protein
MNLSRILLRAILGILVLAVPALAQIPRTLSYQFTYLTTDNDSTLMLTWVDASGMAISGPANLYARKAIGEVVK